MTDILLRVKLDSENIPETIYWKQGSNDEQQWIPAKAFLLSIFEEQTRDTLKLDIWTKDFQMNEMDRFMFNTLQALCETYRKATSNAELAHQFDGFVNYFGEKTQIISPTS